MRDPASVQDRDLRPHLLEERVVDVVRCQLIERGPRDEVVREEHRVAPDRSDRPEAGRAHAAVAREQGDEGFVLDGAAQRRERALVADVLQAQEPVEAIEQVGGALLGAERLHEHLGAVGEPAHVRPGAARVDRGALDHGRRQPGRVHAGADRGPRRPAVGPAEGEEHDAADRRAGGQRDDELGGEVRRHEQPDQRQRRDEQSPGAAPGAAHERGEDDERAGELGQDPRSEPPGTDPRARRDLVHDLGQVAAVERGRDPLDGQPGDDVAEQDVPEEAEPPGHERGDVDRDRDDGDHHLREAGQRPLPGRREEVEQVEDVALDAGERVLAPAGEREQQEGGGEEDRQAEQVARRADVADDLLVGVDRDRGRLPDGGRHAHRRQVGRGRLTGGNLIGRRGIPHGRSASQTSETSKPNGANVLQTRRR